MAIPINGINTGHVGGAKSRNIDQNSPANQVERQKIDTGSDNRSSGSQTGDNVSLSSQAQSLKKIEQELKTQPEVNAERVAEIKAQLESGTYQIDNEKLAQNMLNMEENLF